MNNPTVEDILFIQELNSLAKTAEGARIMRTSPKLIEKLWALHEKYGKSQLDSLIDEVKAYEVQRFYD